MILYCSFNRNISKTKSCNYLYFLPPCSTSGFTEIFCALAKGLMPWVQEAYAPYTYRELEKKLNELKGKLKDAKDKLEKLEQEENGIAILNGNAKNWKQKAKATLENIENNITHLESNIEATCIGGCLPNCLLRRAVRETIRKEDEKVNELIDSYRPVVKGYRKAPIDMVQKTRSEDIRKIWECVSKRDDVKVVCIHGIAGVGKTAVAEAVCNNALLDNQEIFAYVIWVEADYGIHLKKLQEKIMRSLNIQITDTGDDRDRATKIREEIVRRKRCLVIIDFLWENFTLRDIGIPENEAGAEGVVCKVILTLRSLDSRLMCPSIRIDEYFEIKPLSKQSDVWNVFGEHPSLEGEANDLLNKAVENCEGLPSAINMLASRIRGKHNLSSTEIASTLKEMLSSRTISSPSIDAQLLRSLEYSYMRLETTHQQCFLYCALYPKGFPIEVEKLIDNLILEGLLESQSGSLEEKRMQGRNVLTVLKTARLLENADSDGTRDREAVKMLSFLHDMAVNIIFEQRLGVLINAGNDLTDFPLTDDPNGKIQRASFMCNNLGILKCQPNCPKLSTLLLQNNPLVLIDNFFTRIPNLKLLDISYTKIFYLPSSICNLKFLQGLCLRHCVELRSLPDLSNLKELVILDLFGTPVEQLPKGMKRLKKLKRLDLSCTKLTKFQVKLVSALTSLQELLLLMNDAEAYSWRSKQSRSNSNEAYVEELACLDDLRVLQLNFFDKEVFNEYVKAIARSMPRSCAPRFKFCVGGFNTNGNLGENSIAFIDDFFADYQLPERTLELYLSACKCSSLKPNNTVKETGIDFQHLKVLNLLDCSGMIYLFSYEMLQYLQSLERIDVRRCWSLLEIINPSANSSSNPHSVISCCFPKLQELVLIDLPKLETICPGQQILEWPDFRRLSVWNCDKLEKFRLVRVGEHPKMIKLRGKSFKLDDSHCFEREKDDVPEDIISFVSTKKPESTPQPELNPQPMPDNDQTSFFKRKASEKTRTAAIKSEIYGIATRRQSPGYIVRNLDNISRMVRVAQRRIGVLSID